MSVTFSLWDSVQFSAESVHHLQPAHISKHTLRHSDQRKIITLKSPWVRPFPTPTLIPSPRIKLLGTATRPKSNHFAVWLVWQPHPF